MSDKPIFRIHPTIGIARVGNSEEYYLGPETMAGMPSENGDAVSGGLPIVPGTESQTIESKNLRDEEGKLKRQASRFKIFQYSEADSNNYPSGGGEEITVNSCIKVDGVEKTVTDIIWTVHLANKKANSWIEPPGGIKDFGDEEDPRTPAIRNIGFAGSDELNDPNRLKKLVIDAGPKAISAISAIPEQKVAYFDNTSGESSSFCENAEIVSLTYPKLFPSYPSGHIAEEEKIETLGEITTDNKGRLLVLGGFGKASGFDGEGDYDPMADLSQSVNNDKWLDDTSDGPVTAVLKLSDNSFVEVQGSSWVVISDPSYAPQIPNTVTLWDDLYEAWLMEFDLEPAIYSSSEFQKGYKPNFKTQVKPILDAPHLISWVTALNEKALKGHQQVSNSTTSTPGRTGIGDILRDPNAIPAERDAAALSTQMPLSLGDSGESLLSISKAQYFFVQQWLNKELKDVEHIPLGPGELLDKNILANCLGGRFSPGLEMTFIIRDKALYAKWDKKSGPFRINMAKLNYNQIDQDESSSTFLGVGYTPKLSAPVEPGDICKFMSIPWHTDYNSCATHTPAPNPGESLRTTYIITQEGIDALSTTLPDGILSGLEGIIGTYGDDLKDGTKQFTEAVNKVIQQSEPKPKDQESFLKSLDLNHSYLTQITAEFHANTNVYSGSTASGNPINRTTYWSWPAQRPVSIYNFKDVVANNGELPEQRFSVRGEGTGVVNNTYLGIEDVGRYQVIRKILREWHKIGIVMQTTAISELSEATLSDKQKTQYLEVQSQLDPDQSNKVQVWPNMVFDNVEQLEQ